MKLNQPNAGLFIPDETPEAEALARVTHLGIGAHQDDLEFMAFHGVLECLGKSDRWFGGVTCTNGAGAGFPARIALEYTWKNATPALRKLLDLPKDKPDQPSNYHGWIEGGGFEAFYEHFDHPLYLRMQGIAKKHGGHGGMDAIMNFRAIECLRQGLPLDQNVYEGAFWSAVSPLSRKSVAEDSMPQDFPDFTRGQWKETAPLGITS